MDRILVVTNPFTGLTAGVHALNGHGRVACRECAPSVFAEVSAIGKDALTPEMHRHLCREPACRGIFIELGVAFLPHNPEH